MAVGIRVFDATVHAKLQRRRTDLDTRSDFDPFVCLIRRAISEFCKADDVHADLINLHFLRRFSFRCKIHGEGGDDIFRGRSAVIKRDDRHQLIVLREFHAVSLREVGFSHFETGSSKEEWFTRTRHAGLGIVDH